MFRKKGSEFMSDIIRMQSPFSSNEERESLIKETLSSEILLSFGFLWNLISFFGNLIVILSVPFYVGSDKYPSHNNLSFLGIAEVIIILDFMLRTILGAFSVDKIPMFYVYKIGTRKLRSWLHFLLDLISALPLDLIIIHPEAEFENDLNLLFLLKLPRIWYIVGWTSTIFRRTFKVRNLIFLKALQNLLLLLVATHFSACSWMIVNKYQEKDGRGFFERSNMKNEAIFTKYIFSASWAVSTMTGNSYGDVSPQTNGELVLSLVMMVLGASFYGKLFADFATVMEIMRMDGVEKKKKFEHCKEFCIERKVNSEMRRKIKLFYTTSPLTYLEEKYHSIFSGIPLSLQTEISLNMNEELIRKVKFFNLGNPNFVLTIARHLYPKTCQDGEIILRAGEIAEEMFFIKRGKVEVLASDYDTGIAILEEGAYFGEIGLLITGHRTVSIRALSNCVFACLSKEKFDTIMGLFEDQRKVLMKVARQRLKTTKPTDLNWAPDFVRSEESRKNLSSFADKKSYWFKRSQSISRKKKSIIKSSQKIEVLLPSLEKEERRKTETMLKSDDTITTVISSDSDNELDISDLFNENLNNSFNERDTLDHSGSRKFFIIPLSRFFYIWSIVISLALTYNLFLVPFAICFDVALREKYFAIDAFFMIIYFLDIFVNWLTVRKNKKNFRSIIERRTLFYLYVSKGFLSDLLSFLPLDYIVLAWSGTRAISQYLRILRLLKMKRVYIMIMFISRRSSKSLKYNNLVILGFLYILMNHLAACFMYALAFKEYFESEGSSFITYFNNNHIATEIPFLEKPLFYRYVNMVYWALASSTSGAYGDLRAETVNEKIFQISYLIVSRIFFSFLAAEVTNIASSTKSALSEHLKKMFIIKQWMNHIKLTVDLQSRVERYYDCLWRKFKGINDIAVLNDLSQPLKNDLLLSMLQEVVEKVKYFPKSNTGVILSIIQRLKIILIPHGEYVCHFGEMANEMYFIIDGQAAVLTSSEDKLIAVLKNGDYFGELALVSGDISRRMASVKALTDISLASLSKEDFKFLTEKYPILRESIQKIAEERKAKLDSEQTAFKILDKDQAASLHDSGSIPGSRTHSKQPSADQRTEKEEDEAKIRDRKGLGSEHDQFLIEDAEIKTETVLNKEGDEDSRPGEEVRFEPADKEGEGAYLENGIRNFSLSKRLSISTPFDIKNFLLGNNINSNETDDDGLFSERDDLAGGNRNGTGEKAEGNNFFKDSPDANEGGLAFMTNPDQQVRVLFNGKRLDEKKVRETVVKVGAGRLVAPIQSLMKVCDNYFRIQGMKVSVRKSILFLVGMYNMIFIPLNLSFESCSYSTLFFILEGLTLLVLLHNLYYKLRKFKKFKKVVHQLGYEAQKHQQVKYSFYMQGFYLALHLIPFSLIFELAEVEDRRDNFLLIMLQLIRVTKYDDYFYPFTQLRLRVTALSSILEIIFSYFLLSHIFSCLLIVIGNTEEDFNNTWLAKVPAPQFTFQARRDALHVDDSTIYIHAIYWFYVTTSHVGVGDVTALNISEKTYGCAILLLGAFTYVYFFGNLASIVEDLAPVMKTQLDKQYKLVQSLLKSMQMAEFLQKVELYFDYLWEKNKGIDENEILNELPPSLKIDIQVQRYGKIFENSPLFQFKNFEPSSNKPLISSLIHLLKYQIYLAGEYIVRPGEFSNNILIVIEGQVEQISLDLKLLKVLNPGDYFGQLLTGKKEAAYFKALSTCKIGVTPKSTFENISDMNPDWKKRLLRKATEERIRLLTDLAYFQAGLSKKLEVDEDLLAYYSIENCKSDDHEYLRSPSDAFATRGSVSPTSPQKRIYTLGGTTLKSPNTLRIGPNDAGLGLKVDEHLRKLEGLEPDTRLYIDPRKKLRFVLDLVHLISILYNIIFLPFGVVFFDILPLSLTILDSFYSLEGIVNLVAEFRTAYYEDGVLKLDSMRILKRYNKILLFIDIFVIIPFNIWLSWMERPDTPGLNLLFSLIRLARLLQVVRLNQLLNKIEVRKRSLSKLVNIIKSLLLLVCVWHWTSCFWYWIIVYAESRSDPDSYLVHNDLDSKSVWTKLIFSLMFTMNIATTTGYPEQIVYNDFERVIFVAVIYIGDALFAIGFGMIASNSLLFPEHFEEIYVAISRIKLILGKNKISSNLANRVEKYFAYLINMRNKNNNSLNTIKDLIPKQMYEEMVFLRTKAYLIKLPIFKELNSDVLLKEISILLEFSIFMPDDYIIYKGDLGEEMFFLIEGNVKILSSNEQDVVAQLEKGDYFGEIALFLSAKRICSVISGTFCEIYILKKENLYGILSKYPKVEEMFRKEGDRRVREYKMTANAKKLTEVDQIIFGKTGNYDEMEDDAVVNEINERPNEEEEAENDQAENPRLSVDQVQQTRPRKSILKKKKPKNVLKKARSALEKLHQMKSMKKLSLSNKFNLKKVQHLLNENNQEEQRSFVEDSDNSLEEYVEDDELDPINKTHKQSRRRKIMQRERRYSRISLGKDILLSRSSGLKLHWGIHMIDG